MLSLDKLLIIGSTGLVGSKLAFDAAGHGFETYNTQNARKSPFPNSTRLNITDRDATLGLVGEIRPKVIVNTAALTNVDYCETHKEEAENVNVGGVRNLVEAALRNDCRFIQISTDSVFDGTYGHYTESDTPHPLNHYSITKLEAEKVVSRLSNYAISRPSVIYGWPYESIEAPSASTKPMNFAAFVLNKFKNNEKVRAVRDQYSSPTLADNLAEALLRLAKSHENGVFHTAGRSCMSRHEFVIKLAQVFGYPTSLVEPVFTSEFQQVAPRPKNCCLRVDKAERSLGMRFLTAEEGIRQMRRQPQPQGDSSDRLC
jgi:dTDP-4-dehydrorhamnose reductase